jgi:hypothetical protein
MSIRKSHLIGAIAAAAALAAGAAGAQSFDKSVTDALSKDGAVMSQVSGQKETAAQDKIDIQQIIKDQEEAEFQRGGSHGGGHTGGGGTGGGGGRGGDRGGDHGGRGGDHGGRGGDHGGPHGKPGSGPHGEKPGHGPKWGHGHKGGWNDHHAWRWDYLNRPLWLGWLVWGGIGSCNLYYTGLHRSCLQACDVELANCLNSGDPAQCNQVAVDCKASCEYQYDTVWGPYWHDPLICPL